KVCVSCYGGGQTQKWFNGKVFLYDLATDAIANLCHHRSRGTYYGEPHASISPSGRYVLFNSNWYTGKDDGHCAYMLEIPDSAYAPYNRAPSRHGNAGPAPQHTRSTACLWPRPCHPRGSGASLADR